MTKIKRFSANYIFPVSGPPIRNGIVGIDENGFVVEIIDQGENTEEIHSTEFHNGIIVPGFVNAHCHLELSHLKGLLKESTGIAEFVSQVRNLRKVDEQDISKAILNAFEELRLNGTVAVGDICNTTSTLEAKKKSTILCYNFVEQFGLSNSDAESRINQSIEIVNSFKGSGLNTVSITPHSTYSLSNKLWRLIGEVASKSQSPISIHFGESKQEYEFLADHSGQLLDNFKKLDIKLDFPDCHSPFEVVTKFIPRDSKVIFVHNTFTSSNEIQSLIAHFKEKYFVVCPSSNLFIENSLPDIMMMKQNGANIAIGTVSYASSATISVFDQILILLDKFKGLKFSEVINWATINGARALGYDSSVGTIEIGKKPGLNLVTDFDFTLMKPTSKSRIRKLL